MLECDGIDRADHTRNVAHEMRLTVKADLHRIVPARLNSLVHREHLDLLHMRSSPVLALRLPALRAPQVSLSLMRYPRAAASRALSLVLVLLTFRSPRVVGIRRRSGCRGVGGYEWGYEDAVRRVFISCRPADVFASMAVLSARAPVILLRGHRVHRATCSKKIRMSQRLAHVKAAHAISNFSVALSQN
jgi:hypothetical protein